MVKKSDFLIVLSAATILIIVFSTMFLTAKLQRGMGVQASSAASDYTR